MTGRPVIAMRVAIGDYPHTLPLKRGEIVSPWLKLDFAEVKPMHKAFKPMVREGAFDASELALVTLFQAREHGKDFRLLPATMLARFQHGAMLCNAAHARLGPEDLPGKRIGVRSFGQTTGAWLRGILANDYGVDLSGVQWVTFEDGHVAEAGDPPGVQRAPAGKDMTAMLLAGELDAAIYGAEMPNDDRLRSVIPDPEAAARAWYRAHGVVPLNHMVAVRGDFARSNPDAVAEFYRLLAAARGRLPAGDIDTVPFGREATRPSLALLMSYAVQQRLLAQPIDIDALW